jgi:hypothetical protein
MHTDSPPKRDQSAANDARHEVLADNTAQAVRNYLKKLFQEEARFRSRWVWELSSDVHDLLVFASCTRHPLRNALIASPATVRLQNALFSR